MKHVHRLTPVSAFDVPGIESWLQDMSARGLRLIRFRPLFCTFERCEPEDRRYRVEACPHIFSGEVPASMKELYEEFGWEYTDAVGGGLQIFTTTDPNAPEPTSDPRTQADVWVKVRRGRTINCLAPLLVALLDMGILLWTDAQGIFLQYVLLKEGALILFMSAFLLITFLSNLGDRRRLDRIVRQLQEGIPLNHQTVWPRRNTLSVVSFTCAVVLLTLVVVFRMILPVTNAKDLQPVQSLTSFHPLTLEELGEKPQLAEGKDYGNFARRNAPSLLCWNSWQVVQSGAITQNGQWTRLEIDWYEIPFSSVSTPLAQELFESARRLNEDIWWHSEEPLQWSAEWPTPDSADYLGLARTEDKYFQVACIASGHHVCVVRWTGQADLKDHIPELVRMVHIS